MPPPRLAKLTRPRAEGLVVRERLFAALDDACGRPVVWVSGPPGAGKTSLVSSYLEARKRPDLWYQVDGGDADPATFFHYLGIAAAEFVGRRHKPLPLFTEDHAADPEGFARRVFRDLYSGLPEGAVLVLDNFQDASESSSFPAVVRAAAEEIPTGTCLLVLSRAEPPAAFARLRVAQRLAGVGTAPLRFTREEILAIAGDLALDAATLDALEAQACGWAAGIVLILDRVRATGQMRTIGSAENLETVFDYFADQALHAAPADAREMLLRLAYLPRMTVAQADAVTGNPGAGRLLSDLSRRNLFTDRRYGDETTYQFHSLFRAFLRERAREHFGLAEHQRIAHSAAALLQATGQAEDAFDLYVQSGTWDAAARVLVQETGRLLSQGRRHTLRRWLEALPMEVVHRSAGLNYALGMVQFGLGPERNALGRDHLTRAFDMYSAEGDLAGQARAASAIAERFYVESTGSAPLGEWLGRLRALLAEDLSAIGHDERARLWLSVGRSVFYLRPGDPALEGILDRLVTELGHPDVAPDTAVLGRAFLLVFGWLRADATGNETIIVRTDPLLADPGVSDATRVTYLFYKVNHYVGLLAFDDERFHACVKQARATLDDSGTSPLAADFVRLSALLLVLQSRFREARERIVAEVLPHVPAQRASQRPMTHWSLALAELGLGNRTAALEQIRTADAMAAGSVPLIRWLMAPTSAAILMACDRIADGLALADALEAEMGDRVPLLLAGRVEICRAFGAWLEGRREDALSWLRRGLALQSSNPYAGRLLLPDPRFHHLLALAAERGVEPAFVSDLVRRYRIDPPSPDLEAWPWPVRIRALGQFSVENGRPAAARPKASHRLGDLLRALVAFGATGVAAERLADALWPDSDGDAALNALQVSLYRLRKLLGREDAVSLREGRVVVGATVCWVDAWAFERQARALCALSALDGNTAPEATDVLALYQGPLFGDFPEKPWMPEPRRRLHSLWRHLVRKLGGYLEGDSRPAEAAALYERASRLDSGTAEFRIDGAPPAPGGIAVRS